MLWRYHMILVTGAASYLGKKLTQRLIDDGHTVRCLDFEKPRDFTLQAEFIQGDVRDEIITKKACAGVTAIFHLMDIKRPGKYFLKRGAMKKINVAGTANLLFAAKKAGVKRVIFNSTYEVYGKSKNIPAKPGDKKKPVTAYGKDKLKAENICMAYAKSSELGITIFRPAVVSGPGVDDTVILITLYMALGMGAGENRLYLSGDGNTRIQYIHPDDVTAAYIAAYKNPASTGQVYNIGSDNVPTQIEQIVNIKQKAKMDCTIKHLTPRFTRFMSIILKPFKVNYLTKEHLFILHNNVVLDCEGTKKDLGWSPTRDNVQILLETIEWYKKAKL